MLIKDVLSDASAVCTMETYLPDVAQKMSETRSGCVAIVESMSHRNLIGIVTEHDICERAVAKGLNLQRTTAGRVLNSNFKTISDNVEIEECCRKMIADDIKYLAVLNSKNQCVGLITRDQIANWLPATYSGSFPNPAAEQREPINYTDRIF